MNQSNREVNTLPAWICSTQIIAGPSHDRFPPNGSVVVSEPPQQLALFQGNLGW